MKISFKCKIVKTTKIILILFIISIFMSGCSKSNNTLSNEDYELLNDNITSKDITIGSSSEDFIKVYNGCVANVMYGNNNRTENANINDIDYSEFCYVYLPTFFIDDKPINVDSFKKKNNIDTDLSNWINNNPEYLEKHSVIFKCLIFTFEDGNITNIQLSEKNYNE